MRILGPVAQLVGVHGGEQAGGAKGLPDIALTLGLAHIEDVVAHAVGGRRHLLAAAGLDGECHDSPFAASCMSDGLGSAAAASSAS